MAEYFGMIQGEIILSDMDKKYPSLVECKIEFWGMYVDDEYKFDREDYTGYRFSGLYRGQFGIAAA